MVNPGKIPILRVRAARARLLAILVRELPCIVVTTVSAHDVALSTRRYAMTLNDDDLEVQLRAMLAVRRLPSLGRITVRVDDAVVYLGGTVTTYFERNTCEECCRRIEGVVGIENLISVEVAETNLREPGAAVSP